MTQTADIGAKRLISLSPDAWARWLTGNAEVEALDLLSGEFQWVGRSNDILFKVHSPDEGTFLIANEIQFRPDARMPLRLRAYAALAEERYGLKVFPVVINILPPPQNTELPNHYHSEVMGLMAHQDFKVVNLWQVDAELAFGPDFPGLLPFVPVLKGGGDRTIIVKALTMLRVDERLSELESLLAFFAAFALELKEVESIMRSNMAVLRENPWYNEILKEGLVEGFEKGHAEGHTEGHTEGQREVLLLVLRSRFGNLEPALVGRIRALHAGQLLQAAQVATTAPSLATFEDALDSLPDDNGVGLYDN